MFRVCQVKYGKENNHISEKHFPGCKITHELRFGLRVVHDTWKSQELYTVHAELIVKWPREYIFDTVQHFYP